MKTFQSIYDRALIRKGEEGLQASLPRGSLSSEELAAVSDDRFLSQMTRSIFQAGFNWKVIDNKWAGFEEAFWHFDIGRCMLMSPDALDALCQDKRIVRNPQKISTVPVNAAMIADVAAQHGSFAKFIADWPSEDFVGLLDYLNKKGSRLGGMTCQYFLRMIGRDGFVLGKDGVAALIDAGVITKKPTSRQDMQAVQQAYNAWAHESGRTFAEISRILAQSIDA